MLIREFNLDRGEEELNYFVKLFIIMQSDLCCDSM